MKLTRRGFAAGAAALSTGGCSAEAPSPPNTVNDITQLNPIRVARIAEPRSVEEVSAVVAANPGPISIGGGRFSQGGQTACDGALFIDMRPLNRIIALDETARTITVETGATWRQIQEAVDPLNLSPKIMQSYCNFTVGGSLSVNCHGDYVGLGAIVELVRAIRVMLASGEIIAASRDENRDVLRAAIGGYGGIGIITEATLDLAENEKLDRTTHHMHVGDYPAWHRAQVLARPDAVLHHAVIYPGDYTNVAAEVSVRTSKPVTVPSRLARMGRPSALDRFFLDVVAFTPSGRAVHEKIYDPLTADRPAVVWRNYEAAQDAYSLEPASRARSTYALQEYFVPVDRFEAFAPRMARILNAHQANVLNVAVRHARPDAETFLAWARAEVYSFVLYYEQGTTNEAKAVVGAWTRELIAAAIAEGGSFYLPYQIQASRAQLMAAYPRAGEYFAMKQRVDPSYKFRNRLWEAYYS